MNTLEILSKFHEARREVQRNTSIINGLNVDTEMKELCIARRIIQENMKEMNRLIKLMI